MTKDNKKEETQCDIHVVSNSMVSVEYRDLKTEFLAIQNDAIGKHLSMIVMDEINAKFEKLFNHFELRDLQYRLSKNEETIIFTPIRVIDQYAIHGILNS